MRSRQGFTITELLVSLALILFMMAILSEAFVAGLESMRLLKATSDMDAKLRSAITMIGFDLKADHFDDKPLSQLTSAPLQGFLRIQQGAPSIPEGVDADGIPSTRAADSVLHFSIKRKGARPEDYFPSSNLSALVWSLLGPLGAPPDYRSQWAEVAYFLRPTGTTPGSPTALPLFSLHRRQRVLYVPVSGLTGLLSNLPIVGVPPAQLWDVSTSSLLGIVNTPSTITNPANRPSMWPIPLALIDEPALSAYWGADLALIDVLSFDVKVSTGGEFMELSNPALALPPLGGLLGTAVFDTSTSNVRIKALQITIRIWDAKTKKTRQVTIIQNM